MLLGFEMISANSGLRTFLFVFHVISIINNNNNNNNNNNDDNDNDDDDDDNLPIYIAHIYIF